MMKRFRSLTGKDFWAYDEKSLPPVERSFIKSARAVVMVFGIFILKRRSFSMAAALSYATILGIIPLLVVVAALSKGLIAGKLNEMAPEMVDILARNMAPVLSSLPEQGQGMDLRNSIQNYLDIQVVPLLTGLDMAPIGSYGTILLILIAFSMMRSVEGAFNEIWEVERDRAVLRQLARYWLAMALFPAGLLAVVWLTGLGVYKQFIEFSRSGLPGGVAFNQFTTMGILWLVFAAAYKFIPNTKIRVIPALAGGIVGGTVWQFNNYLGFMSVSKVLQTHYLYGSLGILPIFLMSLYVGWLIILFGAHISFVIQNLQNYKDKFNLSRLAPYDIQDIAVFCYLSAARAFLGGGHATLQSMASVSGVPSAHLSAAASILVAKGLLTETKGNPTCLMPSMPPELVRVSDVLRAVSAPEDGSPMHPLSHSIGWIEAKKLADRGREDLGKIWNPTFKDLCAAAQSCQN